MKLNAAFSTFRSPLFVKPLILCLFIILYFNLPGKSQQEQFTKPSWWFGLAGGANFNSYGGSTNELNGDLTVSPAFESGRGVGHFFAAVMEYHRPHSIWGVMLQQGIDNRKATFKQADKEFSPNLSYFTVEPSLRIAPFRSNFYLYAGPRLGFLWSTSFTYKRTDYPDFPDKTLNPDAKAYMSSLKKNLVSMQIGVGYDLPISPAKNRNQFMISPFVAYLPALGQHIRTIESLNLNTIRTGIVIKAGRGRKILTTAPPIQTILPVIVKDRDGDGVLDDDDRCPDITGLASLRGCPDRDGDGIADIDDKCPDVFGYTRYEGCPIPDRDKDGVNDETDKCPDVFGYARYQGCPIPDTDNDGVNDEEDKCINVPGPANNFGCPVIPEAIIQKVNLAAKNVFFESGSAKLLAKSFGPLKTVVKILADNPTFKISVEGHTDSTGGHDMNMKLSDDRAASVADYLKTAGVDESRISSEGFGPDRPVAPNRTTAGRAKNRRVEMKLRNY